MSDASNGTQTPSLSASTSIPAPLESPFDFKEYEKQFANKKLQESLGELAFPDNDIEVKIEPRVNRTTKSSVPANASNLSDTYLKYCQEYFEQDWVSVDLTKTVSPVPKNVKVPDQEYEVDVVGRTVDKEAAKAEKDETSILRVATKEQLLDERKKDRMPLFTTFHMNKPDTHYSLQKGRPFDTKFATQLLFEAKELKFQLGEIEPFFCTLALYDLKSKKKLTEDFQFDVNTANTSALIQHVLKEVEPATSARSCIFNYSGAKSEDVFLVLFVNKVLKGGSPDDHVDAYCKPQMKDKDKQKFVSETRGNLPRLAEYKQNFAWSAQPLFDARGALTIVGDAVFSDIVKCKGDLFDYLEDIKLNKTKKKRDSIPGEFTFALKLLDKLAEPPNRLTPSLLPVKPFNEAKDMKTIREIQELPYETPTAYPHCNYVNNLYFYPERVDLNNLKASGVSARNIGMEVKLLENDDNPSAEGLKVIYGDSTTAGLVSKAMSIVGYHNKKPKFFDEIKLQLPFQLTNKHHLLLTFYHVDCKPAGKKSKPGDSPLSAPLAYTFIPLLKDGQFLNEEKYSFPVALKLPTNYLSTPEDDILWLDNQKLLMTFSTKLVSSVYTLDTHLNNFLKLSLDPKQDQDKIVAGLEGLASADKKEMVKFFPVITRGLLELIANFPPRISVLSFSTLLALADAVATNSNPDDNVLESFLSFIFDPNPKSNIGDHLLNNWLLAIQNKHVCLKDSLKFAWFLYGLIIKSMVLQLHHEKKLTDNNRTSRFAQSVHDQLMRAVLGFRTLTITFALDPAGSVPLSKLFNITTAHFITDLFAFMDRGFVFELIYNYVQELDPNNESMELTEMKFTFLRALTDYAHYLALNLPLHPKIQTVADIPYRFASKHFLSGLILMQLETTFVATNSSNRAKKMNMAINTLCDAIYKHDHDARYQANLARQRIASIYFPFILTAIDHYDLIAKLPAVSDEKRKLLACFYFVLKGANVELLKDYWERETEKRVFLFLDLMIMATDLFEYHGEHSVRATVAAEEMGLGRSLDLSSTASSVDLSSGDAFADVTSRMTSKKMKTVRKKYGKKTKPALVLDKKPSVMIVNQFMERTTVRDRKQTVNFDVEAKREANFAREISLVSLEVVLHLVASFSVALKNLSMFDKIFGVLINLLRKNQSTSALTVLFQTLNHLIPEVKKPLFSKRNSVCGELVFEFLRLSNSRLRKVRDLAATSFYVLLENNFIQTQNIARVKLQTTIAITRMVGKEPTDFNRLLTSFEPIVRNAKNGLSRNDIYGEPIPKQVEVLQSKINSIIEQSKKMSQYQYDPEMMADLYYKISKEFMESPDERITWLESLAETHRANKHLEECAQTKIVTAALVQAYLSLLGRWEVNTPTAFHLVCPNIDREIEIPSPGTLESLKDEICQSKLFSEEGFVGLLHDAIKSLREGGLYEQCVTAYRMMLPIFQEQEDYERQMNCHLDLFNLCKLLIDENTMNQRIFSNYYRVAFYGKPFKDMDGKEYIYKELNTNRVAEVAENLKVRYERKFGKVVMLPNKDIKPEELDPNVCHIQLGAVEIMPPEGESVTPVKSLYKQYFNINRFVMEQPFTKGGKAQGEIEDQFIRRTIFTTECSFPYVKKRVPVQAKETKELSPIESAAMLIEKKIRSLKTELDSATPNTKILQRELQGSLLTQVNAGPLAIAQIFLSDASADKFSAQHRANLAELLMEFERLLGFGVRLNKSLIHDDMIPLQEGLENGYQVFRNELEKHKIFGEQRELKSKQREQKQMEEAARARQTMGQIEEELQSRRRSKSGASSMQPKKKVDTPLQRIAVSSTVTAPKTSTSPVVTKPVVEKKTLPTTPPAPNTPPNAEPKRDRAATTTAPTRTTSNVAAQGPDSRKSMVLNMNNVTNGEKTDPAKSPTPVSPSAKKASLGSSSASNKTNTTPTTSPSGVKAAAAKLNNNNAKEDEAAAKLTGFHTKITQIVVDIQTDLNALSLKILAALTPEEAGGCIPYVKTIKAEVEKMRASVKINTTANVTVTPRGNNEDKLNYVVDVLSREIENLRKQFAEIKENVVKVDDATKLMNLAQSLKVVKTEITMAAK